MPAITNTELSPIDEALFISKKQIENLKKLLPSAPTEEYGIILIKTDRGGSSKIPFKNVHLVKETNPKVFLNQSATIGVYRPTPPIPKLHEGYLLDEEVQETLALLPWDAKIEFVYFRLKQIDRLLNNEPGVVGVHFRFEFFTKERVDYFNLLAYRAKNALVFDSNDSMAAGFPCPPDWKP